MNPNEEVSKIFNVTKMASYFNIYGNEQDAVDGMAG